METISKAFLSLWLHFKEGVAAFVYAINGDIYLGEDYHCIYEKLPSGRYYVNLYHEGADIRTSATHKNLVEAKLIAKNDLDNLLTAEYMRSTNEG